MSIPALNWTRVAVRVHGKAMTPTEKLLLRHLGDIVGADGTWCETRDRLMEDLVIGDRTLDRAVRGLTKLGLLRVEQRPVRGARNLANRWCLPLDVPQNDAPEGRQIDGGVGRQDGAPSSSFTQDSTPSEWGAAAPSSQQSLTDDQEDTMTRAYADPDQMGLEGMPEPPAPEPKVRKATPAQEVVAEFVRAFAERWERQPLTNRGHLGKEAKTLLDGGYSQEQVMDAARSMATSEAAGSGRFLSLKEELRQVVSVSRQHRVEAWGNVDPAPSPAGYVEGW